MASDGIRIPNPAKYFPGGPVQRPFIERPTLLGFYGIDKDDKILDGATPPQLKDRPKAELTVEYSSAYMVYVKNPLLRADLPGPFQSASFAQNAIVTARHTLKDLLAIFMNPNDEQMAIRMVVYRVKYRIFLLPDLDSVPGALEGDTERAYGIPFEEAICNPAKVPGTEYCFAFQAYRFVDTHNLVVRCEVDCVNGPQCGEIKCRVNSTFPIPVGFYRRTWAQMILGCTEKVYIGVGTAPVDEKDPTVKHPAVFQPTDIFALDEPAIAKQAKLTTPASLSPLLQLSQLLSWLRTSTNDNDGMYRVFTYTKAAGITLGSATAP